MSKKGTFPSLLLSLVNLMLFVQMLKKTFSFFVVFEHCKNIICVSFVEDQFSGIFNPFAFIVALKLGGGGGRGEPIFGHIFCHVQNLKRSSNSFFEIFNSVRFSKIRSTAKFNDFYKGMFYNQGIQIRMFRCLLVNHQCE